MSNLRTMSLQPTDDTATETIIFSDQSRCDLEFNVMPNRPVTEVLAIEAYRIWKDGSTIEADFCREYHSSMEASPDHLIFLSVLIQTQKLIYVLMCHRLGLPCDTHQEESLKVWPTQFAMKMPKLVRKPKATQTLRITAIQQLTPKCYTLDIESDVEGVIFGTASAYIKVL